MRRRYSAKTPGERLRDLRHERGLTMRQLSELSGIAISDICRLENGQSGLGPRRAKRLAVAMGADPRLLVDPSWWV
jgi:transcriptional regulator with XRE-family HTH domain